MPLASVASCRILFLIAAALAAADVAADAAPKVDEFGLPLPAAPEETAITARMRPAERWKKEVAQAAKEEEETGAAESVVFGTSSEDDSYARFGAAFAEAKVPDCLREDGLKRQPPRILFFGFQGVLAFPFVALAKIRGKCL